MVAADINQSHSPLSMAMLLLAYAAACSEIKLIVIPQYYSLPLERLQSATDIMHR